MIRTSPDKSNKYEKGGVNGAYCGKKYRMNETIKNERIKVSYTDGYVNSLLNTLFL